MKKDTKRIIAREGLILLCAILLSAVIIFALVATELAVGGEQIGQKIFTFAVILLLLAYPIYLLTRFIVWAIRTLRDQ
ncbi:MAG: hypothetical protein HQ579_04620 [Candidatus Omnitrophica bacterium]|nr:hypothetical protein [Candidatus Omnitrophota bacterium]